MTLYYCKKPKNKTKQNNSASAGVSAHLTVMAELVTLLLALMGADDELQVVPVHKVFSDVGAPVAAPATHLVGNAAILSHWVAPQQVQDLEAVDTFIEL